MLKSLCNTFFILSMFHLGLCIGNLTRGQDSTHISNHGLIVIGIAFLLLSLLLGVFSLAENKEKA